MVQVLKCDHNQVYLGIHKVQSPGGGLALRPLSVIVTSPLSCVESKGSTKAVEDLEKAAWYLRREIDNRKRAG
jgi:hypothetical protein